MVELFFLESYAWDSQEETKETREEQSVMAKWMEIA